MPKNNSSLIRCLLCGLACFLFISLLPGSLSQTDTSPSDLPVADQSRQMERIPDPAIARPSWELDSPLKNHFLTSENRSPWAKRAIRASAAAPFAAMLSATKTATDVNGGNAEPGDTLMYSVTITNSGAMDATNVNFTDTIDANTTLVAGSVNVSPLAGNDAYTTIGNTRLTVGFTSVGGASVAIPGQNIFDNDMDFLGDTFTVTAFQNPSAQGGNVSINPIFGRLDYVPPVGFTGTDTISYTITDTGGKSSTATITITVNEVVWYVNNASAAGGDGRSTSPFQTLAPVNGAGGGGDADAPGHFIYVHTGSGNYTTGIELENTQQLIGQGVALVVSSLTLNPAGTKPTISNGSGNGVTLANGNTVRGLTAQTTAAGGASAGIAGSNVGNLSTDTVIAIGNPGAAVDIQTAGTLAVTFESLSSTNGTRGVRLTSATGGTFTVPGTTTITGTTGDGVTITMGNPTVNFSGGVNITTMSGRGIVANAAGTLSTGSSSTVNAANGAALDLQSMNFGTGLNFTSLASTNSTAEGIKINGCIQNLTVSGMPGTTNIQTPTGVGIDIQSIFGTSVFSLGATTVNKTSAGTGVNLANNGTATVGFSSLALTAGNGSGLVAMTAGTVNVTTGTISATNGPALLVNPTTLGMTFTSVTSTNSATTGISLTNASGSLSIGTTTTTNPMGIGISVNTSSATLNFGTTTANQSGGTGVSLTTNTGPITFGDLDIAPDANQKGLLATDNTMTITTTSGTISTSASSGATNAAGVEITRGSGTTPLAIALTSVSTASGANGIILSNTSGSFLVNGDGTNTAVGGNSTGGTISNMSGADGAVAGRGVSLNNATNVTLRRMTINGTNQNFGIRGSSVVGFTLEYSTVGGTNGNNGAFDEGSVRFTELTGSATVTNCNISGGFEDNFAVVNTSGTLNRITFNGTMFGANSTTDGSDGILVEGQNNAVVNTTVQNGTFTSTRGDHFQLNLTDTASTDLVFTGNNITNAHPAVVSGGGGIRLTGGSAGGNVTATYNFSNNIMRDSNGTAIGVTKGAGAGTFSGTINNNQIGVAATANSGSFAGSGISVITAEQGSSTVAITNNQVRQYNNFGIIVQAGGLPTVGSGSLNATVTGNTISNPGTAIFAKNGFQLNSGTVPNDAFQVCLAFGGAGALANSLTGTGTDGGTDFRLRQRQSTTVRLPGYGGANNDDAAVVAFAQANNDPVSTPTGSATNTVPTGGGFVGGAACATPPAPAASFDLPETSAKARTDDPGSTLADDPSSLRIPTGEVAPDDSIRKLMQEELTLTLQAALDRWRLADIPAEDLARLQAMQFEIADLPDSELVRRTGSGVQIDELAAGYGWFFDTTPFTDEEFAVGVPGRELQTTELSSAHGKMDLLTVLMRELGKEYLKDKKRVPKKLRPLMEATLSPSVRRLPDASSIDFIIPEPEIIAPVSEISFASAAAAAAPATPASRTPAKPQRGAKSRPTITLSPQSGETVMVPASGPGFTLPAGKSITIMFNVTINNSLPAGVCSVSNQGTITADGGISIQTDDPSVMGSANPTVTQIVTPPTISCNTGNITTNTDPGLCTASVTFSTTTTGCPVPTVTCTIPGPTTITSPHNFPKGVTTVTCTATNTAGSANCMFTVTVNDNQAPVVTCPSPIVMNSPAGMCSATVNFSATATDNCDGSITPTCTPASGSTFPKGVTTVSCTATDSSSNMGNCSFTVTINDNQAPVVTCPSPISMNSPAGMCSVAVTFTASATDNCDGSITPTCTPASGSTFPKGVTTVNCTATDSSSNMGSCSFTVTINDTQAPVVSCPSPVVTGTTGGLCSAVVNFTSTATDNCDGSITPTCTPASGSTFPKGVTTVSCTATDSSSNMGSCSFTVTVNDDDAPVVTCPSPISMNSPAGMCSATVNFSATATDNCDGSITPTCTPASGSTFPKGVTTVSCTATDSSSNMGSCSFTVTINDNQAPVVTCPSPITMNTTSGACSAVVNFSATATDNCDGSLTPTCTPASGSTFPKGVTTVSCTATDSSSNMGSCSFTVTVDDGVAPVVTCPSPITTGTAGGLCSAVVNFTATATDNCDGSITPTCTPASGSTFPKGVTTVSCTATDSSSNMGSCSFTVTVNDDDAPVVTCPSPVMTGTASNACSAVVNFTATAMDNCDGSLTPVCTPPSGSTFPKGTTTVSCTATDSSSNMGNCSFTVTVVDDDPPVVTCPSPVMTGTAGGLCSAVVNYTATSMDNCDGTMTPTCTPPSGTAFPKGVTTVNCTATDSSANMGNCSFTVTVVDDDPPTISCPPTQVAPPGVVNYPPPTFADNCPGAMVVCNPASGSTFPAGFTTVTCTATDAAGNSAMCSFVVTTFDQAITSDSGGGSIFINTLTGDYMICCGGMIVTGRGTIVKKGCVLTLTHNPPDRRLTVTYDTCQKKGQGVLQMPPGTVKCTIIDSNTRDSIVAPCTP